MNWDHYNYDHFIYKLTFPDNSFYIGCTCHLATRIDQHEYKSKRSYRMPLHRNIKKYGIENMRVDVLHKYPNRKTARKCEARIIEECISDPKSLNRDSRAYRTFAIMSAHKSSGHNINKEKFERLKQKIAFIN